MSRVTLKNVASHAGVSHQTVSNVLNNHPSIRPLTREKVLRAIQALDYQPNQVAKALRQAHVTTLCCVFAGHDADNISDPYRNLIQAAFISEARTHGYSMTTAFVELSDSATFLTLQNQHQQRLFDGVVLVCNCDADERVEQLRQRGIKLVLFDNDSQREDVPSVNADYASGIAALVRHHVQRGRKHLALVLPTNDMGSSARARLAGFQQAAAEAEVLTTLISQDWTADGGEQAVHQLWQQPVSGRGRPDAILAGNDRMAAGALRAAHNLAIDVPGELAISGFDDFEFAQYTTPRLTTVQVPHAEMARQAIRLLLGHQTSVGIHQTFPTRLIERQSS